VLRHVLDLLPLLTRRTVGGQGDTVLFAAVCTILYDDPNFPIPSAAPSLHLQFCKVVNQRRA
jgi:hypothetical protein